MRGFQTCQKKEVENSHCCALYTRAALNNTARIPPDGNRPPLFSGAPTMSDFSNGSRNEKTEINKRSFVQLRPLFGGGKEKKKRKNIPRGVNNRAQYLYTYTRIVRGPKGYVAGDDGGSGGCGRQC